MAHELGHNFGAQHDGEAGGACAAVPLDFLMAPNLNFSETFSQCSLDTMRPVIAAASCVTPAAYAHVELPVEGPPVAVENDTPVTLPFVVSSTGTQAAQGVRLQITVPSSLVVTSIVPTGVCTAGATGLDCNLGSIPAAQQRRVDVMFLPGVLGGYTVDATVSATNNQNTRDNSQHQQVHVLPNSDTSIAVTSSTATALFGDAVDVTINVSSLKSHASKDVRVGFFGAGLTVVSVTVPGGTCDIRPDQTSCLLGDVAPGTTRQIVLRTTAGVVGDGVGEVYLSSPNDSSNLQQQRAFQSADQLGARCWYRRNHAAFVRAVRNALRVPRQAAFVRRTADRECVRGCVVLFRDLGIERRGVRDRGRSLVHARTAQQLSM